ncbi:MAG: alkene reductase [Woeseiaceae bacterium]|nr:alkene reductase [Woeseiaceae bacterium]
MSDVDLFSPVTISNLELQNRIVMAPMTRNRAGTNGAPNADMVLYYGARAAAGLIITEGTQPSAVGQGYPRTPGIYQSAHIDGWRRVTAAVHEGGAKIFLQIMHAGRVSHALNTSGLTPIAPSAIPVSDASKIFTDASGPMDFPVPEVMNETSIEEVQQDHERATRSALEAGFDGVELHATGGYLMAQFMSTNTNRRLDKYGGSAENRVRLVVETLERMIAVAGSERVGIRVSPGFTHNDLHDKQPLETHRVLLAHLAHLRLAYLHVMRVPARFPDVPSFDPVTSLREHFDGPIIATGGFDRASAERTLRSGAVDLIGFGRPFIANPDLVARMKHRWPLAEPDPDLFYTPGPHGYTDYPTFDDKPNKQVLGGTT